MDNILKTLALVCVFFVLTPGVLIQLPIKGGIYKIAAVHALLFGAIYFIVTNVFGVLREGVAVQQNCAGQLRSGDICNANNHLKFWDSSCKKRCSAPPATWSLKSPMSIRKDQCVRPAESESRYCNRDTQCDSNKTKNCQIIATPPPGTWVQQA